MDSECDLSECYSTIMTLVDEVGEIIKNRFLVPKTVQTKATNIDLVTETDQQVERHLIDGIKKKFPSHKFIGEEETSEGKKAELTDAPTWIIDPVDGTMNFVHNFPYYCVSVALLVDKIAEIAIVFNPIVNQKFSARRGQGAFLNGKQIHVSGQANLSGALVATEFGPVVDENKLRIMMDNVEEIVRRAHGVRICGAGALNLSMVALGAADAYYEFGPHAWDMAAGSLLVQEAGGVTLDPSGGPLDIMSRRVLASSTISLANEIIPLLKQFHPERDD